MESDDLSVGTYSIPAGGQDDQSPHTEDEIYVVRSGRATLVTDSGIAPVEPGSVIYVPAGEQHRFTDVTKDLALIVIFAPPYGARAALANPESRQKAERAASPASAIPSRASSSARSLSGSPA